MICCIIVEDEKSAQDILISYIDKTPFLNCIGVFESGLDISNQLLTSTQLLFLDIELPEINGISYLKTINNPPKTIITTAYSNYAVDAFEENTIDYLVKPFSYERFFKAISRVKHLLQLENEEVSDEVFLYADKTFHKVRVSDILYLKAEVDYVNVVTKEKSILVLDSLRNWEERLAGYGFAQIHRSYIVNTKEVSTVNAKQVKIKDKLLPVGKTYRDNLFRILNIN